MNKKGMELTTVVVGLVVLLVVAVILFMLIGGFGKAIGGETNQEKVRLWVAAQGHIHKEGFVKGGIIESGSDINTYPPVPELAEPIEINRQKQLESTENPPEAFTTIADSMVDCWNAFEQGEVLFRPNVLGGDKAQVFCYSCRGVWIDDAFRDKKLTNFKEYLETEPVDLFRDETYMEYLSNVNDNYAQIIPEELDFKNDIFIYFTAFYKEKKMEAGATYYEAEYPFGELQSGEEFYPAVIIGDAQLIDGVCRGKPADEGTEYWEAHA